MREVNRPPSAAFITSAAPICGSAARGPGPTSATAVCGVPGLSTSTSRAAVGRGAAGRSGAAEAAASGCQPPNRRSASVRSSSAPTSPATTSAARSGR